MATLILTSVGNALGGPIGGAIGGIVGQQIDGALFGSKRRQGSRLGDLSVQTSSYGTAIPKIFGTMRVAGTVIWATDLREERASGGGGKGQSKTAGYTYSASFAVALSGRPIRAVRRIWADGKLLRGAAGDFKSRTGYRLYKGTEDQEVDSFIASAEGLVRATAFRGTAYAMFEDFQLADYGNRIPSLTFEVEADHGPVPVGEIAQELSAGLISGDASIELTGFAAAGDSIRGAIEDLLELLPVSICEAGGRLSVRDSAAGEVAVVPAYDQGARSGESGGATEVNRSSLVGIPDEVTLAYHDPEREYQTGLQRASLNGSSVRGERRAIPAVLSAGQARALAEDRLAALVARRDSATVHVVRDAGKYRPGTLLKLDGLGGVWRVQRWEMGKAGLVTLSLERAQRLRHAGSGGADAGRSIGSPDDVAGPTKLFLFDIPALAEPSENGPRVLAVAAGTTRAWRGAELDTSLDGGASWVHSGRCGAGAICGYARTRLAPAGSALFDEANTVEVELLNSGMWLEGRSDAALFAGANLAVIGDEIVQFGGVEAIAPRRFKLSRLLRGRRGTEWAAGLHSEGDKFALLDAATATAIPVPASKIGQSFIVTAEGLGDDEPERQQIRLTGETVRPPAPVHLTASRSASGDILIRWIRRSRRGWDWLDNSDAPLGEEREAYRLVLAGASKRSVETIEPFYNYTVEQQQADELASDVRIEVVQLGTVTASRPAQITLKSGERHG